MWPSAVTTALVGSLGSRARIPTAWAANSTGSCTPRFIIGVGVSSIMYRQLDYVDGESGSMPEDTTDPFARGETEARIRWDRFPYDQLTAEQRPSIITYQHTTAGIEGCFHALSGENIRTDANNAAQGRLWDAPAEADAFITVHFGKLDVWHQALDVLDRELRALSADGSRPEWATEFMQTEAWGLFRASNSLLRAVAEYHHGVAGPELHGSAYALSTSLLSLF